MAFLKEVGVKPYANDDLREVHRHEFGYAPTEVEAVHGWEAELQPFKLHEGT